ncbi:M48 family metallopeptidase [Flammeovirga sp. SubArs3]|uniref:M48 family metallopeptidase n=1 Tax=Flammeovirga sp. SubArs3 TaxID=2995316 RepID=UPI00248C0D46|nr:M48 family metallopeptidase [Flammeovirga sp. SubArs3]
MTKDQIELSPSFKNKTRKAIFSIIIFVLIYGVLLSLATLLTAFCIYIGGMIIINAPRLITIGLGIGLISMGILIMIFLLKFIFQSTKEDKSNFIEVYQKDEPELFSMLQEIVEEVDTHFPKHVYLTDEVNAFVFYNSSFWSMFLPIRKNLVIGLGLINSVSKSELKAILAHEFGHFSQRTMKVGSYVYNVNQVIYNILYNNEGYTNMASNWASISGYFSVFVVIAFKINMGVQWILQQCFEWVNKSYMGLSREMEFHADEISAHVAGSTPLKTSLLRIEFASKSLNNVIRFYQEKSQEKIYGQNLYNEHRFVMNFTAQETEISSQHGLPQLSLQEEENNISTKLNINEQWSSHPSTKDRIDRLDELGIHLENIDHSPANSILSKLEEYQKKMTLTIYEGNIEVEGCQPISMDEFEISYKEDYQRNNFSKLYNGYYNLHNPVEIDLENKSSVPILFDDLFNDDVVTLTKEQTVLESDIHILTEIAYNNTGIKKFEYDGEQFTKKKAGSLIHSLKEKLEELNEKLSAHDQIIYQYFINKTDDAQLENLYDELINFDNFTNEQNKLWSTFNSELEFIQTVNTIDDAKLGFLNIKSEKAFKECIKELIAIEELVATIPLDMKENFEMYVKEDLVYLGVETYNEKDLNILLYAVNSFQYLLNKLYMIKKKQLLQYQIGLETGVTV